MSREAKRAQKSETPQQMAAVSPRRISKGEALALLNLQPEDCHHLLQVFPNIGFGGRVPQQVRRMIGGHQFCAAPLLPLATKLRDALSGLEKRLRRAST